MILNPVALSLVHVANDTHPVITDCLGRTRPIEKIYAEGSYNCPFCSYAVYPKPSSPGCENPACSAGTRCFDAAGVPLPACVAAFAEHVYRAEREAKQRAADAALRESIARTHLMAQNERLNALSAALAEAADRGACPTCVRYAHLSYRPIRFVKHRGACPRV